MAGSIGTAFVDVAFDPKQISGQLGGLGGKVEGGFAKMGGKWGAAAATGFGAAVVAGVAVGKYLYDVGAQFDDMADTIRVSTGKTGKQLESLSNTAKQVGTDVPASFEDAGKAVASVSTRLELTGKPLRTVSDQMLELARLSGTDLSTALNSVTRMLGDAGMSGADASKGIDELWRASQATQVPVTRLADLLTKFGGPMRQLGFSFEEQAALLGKFEKEGVNTELVMGSMRIALGKMAKAGKDPQVELRKTMEAIKETGSQSTANAKAIELFGARAGPDMAAAIREGRFSIDDLVKTIGSGHDTVLNAGKDTADFSENWLLFKNKVAVAVAPAAEAMFTAIGKGMAYLTEELPPLIAGLKRELGPTIVALGPLFDDLGAIIHDLMPVFKVMLAVVEDVARGIANELKALATVLGGIVKVIRGLIEGDWSMVWDGAKQILRGFTDFFKAVVRGWLSIFGDILAPFKAQATDLGNSIKNAILAPLRTVDEAVHTALSAITGAIRSVVSAVTSAARAVGQAITSGVMAGLSGLLGGVRSVLKAVGAAVATVRGIVTAAVSGAAGWLVSAGAAIVGGLVSGIRGALGAVAAAFGSVKGAVMGVFAGASGWLLGAGADLVAGFANGIRGAAGRAASEAASMASNAWHSVTSFLRSKSPSRLMAIVGADFTLGFAGGIESEVPKSVQAATAMAQRSVDGAKGALERSVGGLSAYLSKAFAATSAARDEIQTPAEKALAKLEKAHDAAGDRQLTSAEKQLQAMQDARDEADRQEALADARAQQAAATTDEERVAAAKAVSDALYAIKVAQLEKQAEAQRAAQDRQAVADDAEYQRQVAALQAQADAERTALEGQQFVREQAFQRGLSSLETYLESTHATTEGAQKKITGLMASFGISFEGMGDLLGTSFEKGIRKSTTGVENAVDNLADVVARALRRLRALAAAAPAPKKAGGKAGPAAAEGPQAALAAASPAALGAPSGGTLYGARSPFAGVTRAMQSSSPAAVQAGPTIVRVYIGDEELRGIVRTEVGYADDSTARILLAGAR